MTNIDPVLLALLVPAILGVVEFIKTMGLTGKALTAASMVVGVVLSVAAQLLPSGPVQVVLIGILFGLAASGLYDISKLIGGSAQSTSAASTEKKQA